MTESSTKTLFGFPVWKSKIEPLSYNKNIITNVINDNYTKQPYRNKWKAPSESKDEYLIHHSYDDHYNENQSEPDFSSLIDVYCKKIHQFMNETGLCGEFAFKIVNYTVINQGQCMPKHHHLNLQDDIAFAATHYLSFDKNDHSSLRFHNDTYLNMMLSTSRLNALVEHQNSVFGYLNNTYTLDIEEDDLVIFPSCLMHSVPLISETTSKKNRICVALNIQMARTQELI